MPSSLIQPRTQKENILAKFGIIIAYNIFTYHTAYGEFVIR